MVWGNFVWLVVYFDFALTCTTGVLNYVLEICDSLYAWVTYLKPSGNPPVEPIQFSDSVQVSSVASYSCAHSFEVSYTWFLKALC